MMTKFLKYAQGVKVTAYLKGDTVDLVADGGRKTS